MVCPSSQSLLFGCHDPDTVPIFARRVLFQMHTPVQINTAGVGLAPGKHVFQFFQGFKRGEGLVPLLFLIQFQGILEPGHQFLIQVWFLAFFSDQLIGLDKYETKNPANVGVSLKSVSLIWVYLNSYD